MIKEYLDKLNSKLAPNHLSVTLVSIKNRNIRHLDESSCILWLSVMEIQDVAKRIRVMDVIVVNQLWTYHQSELWHSTYWYRRGGYSTN